MLRGVGRYIRQHHLALIALFVALSGTAYATSKIGPNDIARNAVRSKHIKNGQVKRGDQARDQQTEWAVVSSNRTILSQSGGISVAPYTIDGEFHVKFPHSLGTRPITATLHGGGAVTGQISATRCGGTAGGASCSEGGSDTVFVKTTNSSGNQVDMTFILVVLPK